MKIKITFILCLFVQILIGQTVEVRDFNKGFPLEMVGIYNTGKNISTATNNKGQANIAAFRGKDSIFFSYLGYKTINISFAELEAKDFKVFMKINPITLGSVVIAATRFGQSSREVPNRINSISAEKVALHNPQTAADLLATSGEVFIQKSQQGGGSPMIRGFSTNRLLYTVDGVRMNTAIFRSGNLHNVISLDPFAIEATEVFFGPGSIIYGSDAIGGVMSFRTLTPLMTVDDETLISGKALTRYASANNEKTTHFDINLGWKKWAMLTSITTSDFSHLRMGSKGPDDYLKPFYVLRMDSLDKVVKNEDPLLQNPTGYSQMNIMQKVRFMPNENWDFQYGFHYSETSSFSRYDRLIETDANGIPRSAEWKYGPQKWMMNLLSIAHYGYNKLYDHLLIRTAMQRFEESRIDRRFNHHRLRTQTEDVDAWSLNVDLVKTINKHKIFYGVEGVINEVTSRAHAKNIYTEESIAVPNRYPDANWVNYAAYINYQYRLNEKLLLQSGVRYTHYLIDADFTRNLQFYPFDFNRIELNNYAITTGIGAIYTPSESWTISLMGSSGFRAPNIDDIGKMFDFQAGDVIVPNKSLGAENAYNAEINIAKVIGEVLKIDASAYYTMLDNAMVRRPYLFNGQDSIMYNDEMSKVYAIQNAASAYVMGAHFGFELMLPFGLGISSRFNYQKGEEEMEDGSLSSSRHAAPWFGITRLSYSINKFDMQLYTVYNGEISHANLNEEERQKAVIYAKDDNGNPYAPAWYTLNFKTIYPITENFSVSAGIENITDQRYRPYSSGLTAPGRNFILSLRALF